MQTPRFGSWYAIFGLLPFWASLVVLIVGGTGGSSAYWVAAPWMVVIAVPYCAITLAMVAVTHGVYVATGGDSARKLKFAAGCFVLLSAVVLAGIAMVWNHHEAEKAELKALQEAGRVLVERHPLVTSTAPAGFRVSISTWQSRYGAPVRFIYFVDSPGLPGFKVIVDVSRSSTEPQLELACMIAVRDYQNLPAGTDPCQSSSAIAP
jgi:hypothetical protein